LNLISHIIKCIFGLLSVFGLAACQIEVEKNLNVIPPDSIEACTAEFMNAVLDKDVDFIIDNWDQRWRDQVTAPQTTRVIDTLYKGSFETKPQRVSTQRGGEKDDESFYTTYHIPHELGRDEILIGVYEDETGNCIINNLTVNFNTDRPFNALKKPEKRAE